MSTKAINLEKPTDVTDLYSFNIRPCAVKLINSHLFTLNSN